MADDNLVTNWDVSNYARDLIEYAPKYRFLFKAIFELDPSVQLINLPFKNDFQYIIKEIDKPTVSFEYEDVNYYNFRTKVLKKINHDPLSITVIDDIRNTFYNFFRNYLNIHSPAARTYNSSVSIDQMQTSGFTFSSASEPGGPFDSAIRGEFPNGILNPFKSIRIQQFHANGRLVDDYFYVNPRIVDFNFEPLNYEGGDQGQHCTIRFEYDFLQVQKPSKSPAIPEFHVSGTDMSVNTDGNSDPFTDNVGSGDVPITIDRPSPFDGGAGGGGNYSLPFSTDNLLGSLIPNIGGDLLSNQLLQSSSGVRTVGLNTVYGMTKQINPNLVQISPIIEDDYT